MNLITHMYLLTDREYLDIYLHNYTALNDVGQVFIAVRRVEGTVTKVRKLFAILCA